MPLSIQSFGATYLTVDDNGKREWMPCTVVGVMAADRWSPAEFVILIDAEDGNTYPHVVDKVRKPTL